MKASHLLAGAVFAAAFAAAPAQATTILGADFPFAPATAGPASVGGISWTAAGGNFQRREATSSVPGTTFVGVGISNKTTGEIDIDETLKGHSAATFNVHSIILGLLFDGPEFGDVQERAKITITFGNNQTSTYYLTNTFQVVGATLANDKAEWTKGAAFPGGTAVPTATVTVVSPSNDGNAAVWRIDNPFTETNITKIKFTAEAGVVGNGGGTNQSDYMFIAMAVPEPATLGLLGAGLLGLGFAARRRKAA